MSGNAMGAGAAEPGCLARPRRSDVTGIYDRWVRGYEAHWSPVILPPAVTLIRRLGLTSECVVADVGAGTGALLGAIMTAAPGARIVALDASAAMLTVAAQRGAPAIRADALALPLADRVADAVVLAYVLFHLAEPARALAEAARVLRPGGRVGTVTWAWERGPAAQAVWDDVLADTGVPPAPLRRVDAGLNRPDALAVALRAAGLRPDHLWPVQLKHRWDRSSFWELSSGSGVNQLRLSMVDATTRAQALARIRDRLDRLDLEHFWWEAEVICAISSKQTTG